MRVAYASGAMSHSASASPDGTARFRRKHANFHADFFRSFQELHVSSIGLGTYLGDSNDATDALYAEAIEAALNLGCNVLDTAVNYRCQRSERVIGRTLNRLFKNRTVQRDEVLICTKGGYLFFDGEVPGDPGRYAIDTLINPGLAAVEDIIGGSHCISPAYLDHALQTSRRNLGLETIDAYYLHNPEQQLDALDRPVFLQRIENAFRLLEERVQQNHIRCYGIATWNGLRVNPQEKNYLSLEALVAVATRIGGTRHHFRMIQLPYNLAMPEAFTFANQTVDNKSVTVLEAARRLGLAVISSAGLLQSRLASLPGALADRIPGLATSAQRALQFARSTPGILTALVGMKQRAHVQENLSAAQQPLLSEEAIAGLFSRTVQI